VFGVIGVVLGVKVLEVNGNRFEPGVTWFVLRVKLLAETGKAAFLLGQFMIPSDLKINNPGAFA
jgi:hypothetical protein